MREGRLGTMQLQRYRFTDLRDGEKGERQVEKNICCSHTPRQYECVAHKHVFFKEKGFHSFSDFSSWDAPEQGREELPGISFVVVFLSDGGEGKKIKKVLHAQRARIGALQQ